MNRVEREIHGRKYLYLSDYNRDTRQTKNIYCGLLDNPKSRLKACTIELQAISNAKKTLTARVKALQYEMEQIRNEP